MLKTVITADSTSDLSPALKTRYGIDIVPLYVTMGEESFRDGLDVSPSAVYQFVSASGVLPKTSAPTIVDYLTMFEALTSRGYEVVHLNISSGFSTAHQNAMIAAAECKNVYPVDSRNLSTGTGHLVIEAARMAEKGLFAQEIAAEVNALTDKVCASFIIDTLDYLHKGGRCSSVAALGANLLKLKPCIEVKNGFMEVGKKYKGNLSNVLVDYVTAKLAGRDDIRKDRIFITHTGCSSEIVQRVADKIKSLQTFDEILETTAGCTITSHCGPNTLGILFMTK